MTLNAILKWLECHFWIIKLREGLPKFMRVFREGNIDFVIRDFDTQVA